MILLVFALTTLFANQQSPPAASRPPAAGFAEIAKRADAAREAGRVEEAIGLYRQGLRVKPDWKEGRWYLGTSYYELDRYAAAAMPLWNALVAAVDDSTSQSMPSPSAPFFSNQSTPLMRG